VIEDAVDCSVAVRLLVLSKAASASKLIWVPVRLGGIADMLSRCSLFSEASATSEIGTRMGTGAAGSVLITNGRERSTVI
jgi:hypothetical protein